MVAKEGLEAERKTQLMSILDDFLKGVGTERHDLIRSLDSLIRETVPELVASLKWGHLTYHHTRNVCAIVAHDKSLNLQVWGGATLQDPCRLLVGTGKSMRHVKFSGDVIENPIAVAEILKQAASASRG